MAVAIATAAPAALPLGESSDERSCRLARRVDVAPCEPTVASAKPLLLVPALLTAEARPWKLRTVPTVEAVASMRRSVKSSAPASASSNPVAPAKMRKPYATCLRAWSATMCWGSMNSKNGRSPEEMSIGATMGRDRAVAAE